MNRGILNIYKNNYYAEGFDTSGLVVLPEHLEQYGIKTFIDIANKNDNNSILVKYKGDIYGIKYIDEKSTLSKGDILTPIKNYVSTGKGIYLFGLDSRFVTDNQMCKNSKCLLVQAKDAIFYKVIYYNGYSNFNQIIIDGKHECRVLEKFDNRDEFSAYDFSKYM